MDDDGPRIEAALERTFARLDAEQGPPELVKAVRHAVFPGGSRFRPRLCLAVATAAGDPDPVASEAAAVAVEFVHCASLVHDDLPCFDDAPLRRGRPSVQAAFGEATAVLVGDALLVMAFQSLATAGITSAGALGSLIAALAEGAGSPRGIIAGQAWESEPRVSLLTYHHAKTAALFEAACALGAIAAAAPPQPWRRLGRLLGHAYQVADDIADATADELQHGKLGGKDVEKSRPNAVVQLGEDQSRRLVDRLLAEAVDAVPPCAASEELRAWIAEASVGVLRVRVESPRPRRSAMGDAAGGLPANAGE